MANALAFMIVIVPFLAQDVPIAVSMMPRFAFLALIVGAAHGKGVKGLHKAYNYSQ
jgi:hypothetical protein